MTTKKKKKVGPLYEATLVALKEPGEKLRAAERAAEQAQADFELACGQFMEPHLNGATVVRLLAPRSSSKQEWRVTLEFPPDLDVRQYREAFNEVQGRWKNYVAHAQWIGRDSLTSAYDKQGIELFLGVGDTMLAFPVGMEKADVEAWLAARGITRTPRVANNAIVELEARAEVIRRQLQEARRQLRELRGRKP